MARPNIAALETRWRKGMRKLGQLLNRPPSPRRDRSITRLRRVISILREKLLRARAPISRDPMNMSKTPGFEAMWQAFACNTPKGNPDTPDRLAPDVFVTRRFRTYDLEMPDGEKIETWGFVDPEGPNASRGAFPSDPIRIVEGQLFHGALDGTSKGPHTIHWHGIEPTPMNDGVGKLSFEVSSRYTYQWYASTAGTYFYHCHHNTVLHFELGMYGTLIIDPPKPPDLDGPQAPYPPGGPGFVRRIDQIVPYDVEAVWVSDDIDPDWRMHNHDAGMSCDFRRSDMGLNLFAPRYFVLSGVPHPWSRNLASAERGGVAAQVKAGQTLLVRFICASYCLNRVTFGGLEAEIVAIDGRTLGRPPTSIYSEPYILPAGSPLELTTAQRLDMLFRPGPQDIGVHTVRVEFNHYVTGQTLGVAETLIHVTA